MKTKLTLLAPTQDYTWGNPLPIKATVIEEGVSMSSLMTTRFHDGACWVVIAIEIINDDGTPL